MVLNDRNKLFSAFLAIGLCFLSPRAGLAVPEADPVPAPARGALVRIPLPLPGNSARSTIDRIARTAEKLLDPALQTEGVRPLLLLELVPAAPSKFGEGCDFYAAQQLVEYLTDLAGVKTIAYVPQTIKGHGLLIAMACEEIVMPSDAEIGEAGIDEAVGKPVRPIVRTAYEQIARARRTIPEAIGLGMVDRSLQVWKVETEGGTEFALAGDKDALKEHHEILSEAELVSIGSLGNFTGSEARQHGFVKYLVNNRAEVADAYNLPPSAVVEDQSISDDPRPILLEVSGPITSKMVRQLSTMIADEKKRGTRWIGVRVNSRGGEIEACLTLADILASQDPSEVRTVALVPVEAVGGAAIVALACDQLVMQPDARLGGDDGEELEPGQLAAATESIRSLSENTSRDWSVFAAMIDRHLEVFKYRHKETGRVRYFSPAEVEEQADSDDWVKQGAALTEDGKPWELSAERAKDLGIAWQTVSGVEGLAELYGLKNPPMVVEPNWALEIIEALAAPGFATVLVMIGILGLYIELQAPGIGIGGFVSAVAFMLFFWSNFLHGTAEWLEVLLFICGICFILLEIFVLPGFGIFGLGGGLMILASLILASQTFVFPQNSTDNDQFVRSILIVVVAVIGVGVGAMLIRVYLPHMPMFSRILLTPPDEVEREVIGHREVVAEYSHLLGQIGTAATNLRPSGKGSFGDDLVDVIAADDPIERGHAIEVIEVHGNRVVVQPMEKI